RMGLTYSAEWLSQFSSQPSLILHSRPSLSILFRCYDFVVSMPQFQQKKITDYFKLDKASWPRRSLGNSLPLQENDFRTILDLPNELLLYISDLQITQPTDLNAATQLYAVCKRFYSVYTRYAFNHLSCNGTKQLFLLNQALKKEILSADRVTLALLPLQQLP
ncbi:12293_t:CDS:1, partial [Acaulospora colombiana]